MTALKQIHTKLGMADLSIVELLQTTAAVLNELKARKIVRTNNGPIADYTEWLVCRSLGLEQETNSNKGFDAQSADGTRYEIKGRRPTTSNKSTQLSAIRQLEKGHFDYLIGVIFEEDYSVKYAAKVPHRLVDEFARFSKHSNGHLLNLTPKVLAADGVEDVSDQIID